VSLTFVVGTSRCGSTMLSIMLSVHPEVLSISEFWNIFIDTEGRIPTHDMTGDEFWQRISKPAPLYDGLVSAGLTVDEKIFPSRFSYETGMPSFCRILAWSLDTDASPDPLYDSLAEEACGWPERSLAEHCRALFESLAARQGRRVIVERTGGSMYQIGFLLKHFPDARFVFLHRNGPDTVLSMSRYPHVRLAALRELAASLASSSSAELDMVPPELRKKSQADFSGIIEPPFDKERFREFPIPLSYYAGMWSTMTRMGTREIRTVAPDKRITLRYERLLTDTRAELTRLTDFIGVAAVDQWLDWASGFANPGRIGSAARLHPLDLAELRSACTSGNRAFDLLEAEQAASPSPLR
jgi:Sulfotransferase family